jgi:hypothetical protein
VVPHLLTTIVTFEEASNQKLNLCKVEVLHLAPDPPPHAPHALTVVEAATNLGICFSLSDILAHWRNKNKKVQNSINRVCSLLLSAFGRAFTLSSYALARLLFHMELSAPSSLAFLTPVVSRTRKLKDHGNFNCDIMGLPRRTMIGTPREGWGGLLPLLQHCCSRHECP